MIHKSILAVILALAVVSLACGITVQVPIDDIRTGLSQTMTIDVPAPSGTSVDLSLGFGAGELNLAPGAVNSLVQGSATYNVEELKPQIKTDGNQVEITSGDLDMDGLPAFRVKDLENVWNLKLGSQPMSLEINAGAYRGKIELGGLSVQHLQVTDGAADVDLNFDRPNLVEMDRLIYSTGASEVSLSGLANANFSLMDFRGGAGSYTLDFSGELQRSARVQVDAGISQLIIIVPQGMSAIVTFEGGVSNIDADSGWQRDGNEYVLPGSGPTLAIEINLAAGNLELRIR